MGLLHRSAPRPLRRQAAMVLVLVLAAVGCGGGSRGPDPVPLVWDSGTWDTVYDPATQGTNVPKDSVWQ
jgi:hypothetical protein